MLLPSFLLPLGDTMVSQLTSCWLQTQLHSLQGSGPSLPGMWHVYISMAAVLLQLMVPPVHKKIAHIPRQLNGLSPQSLGVEGGRSRCREPEGALGCQRTRLD